MTLCAITLCDGIPLLLADFLVTGDEVAYRQESPLFPEIGRESATPPGTKIAGLKRKTLLVNPGFLVAAAGDLGPISDVFRRLKARFADGPLVPEVLRRYLDSQADRLEGECHLVGWLIAPSGPVGFRWESARPDVLQEVTNTEIGSGADYYRDLRVRMDLTKLDPNRLADGAFETCLHSTATFIANEMVSGNTLLESFGGGYEIYCYAGGQFIQMKDVNYLFFGITVVQKDTLDVRPVPILIKCTAIGEAILIRSFIPRNFIDVPTDESERAALAEPITGEYKVPDITLASLPLEAARYVICMVGEAINGKKEIFTAIVSGAEAATFKIYLTGDQRDGKHEIRFELPPQIMENIKAQRSGPANLNSTISGNSGHDAGLKARRKGVFDGQEESIGSAHAPHPQFDVQGSGGPSGPAGRQDLGRAVRAVRVASEPDHRMEATIA